jgi:hypothetical protein
VALQRGESQGEGKTKAVDASKAQAWAVIGLAVTLALSVLGGLSSLIFFLATKK